MQARALTLCSFWCHSSMNVPFTSLILLRCMMFRISSRTAWRTKINSSQKRLGNKPHSRHDHTSPCFAVGAGSRLPDPLRPKGRPPL